MFQKRFSAFRLLALFWVVLLLAGCVAPTAPSPATDSAPSADSPAPTNGFPLTIENCGRTLTFAKPPERIVTTYPNAAELLIRLGVGERIVGSMYHNDTSVTADVAEAFAKLPQQFAKYPSKEEFVTLQADFALATYDTFDFSGQDGMPTPDEAAALGTQVYGISTECGGGIATQATLSMIFADVLNLGKIFGVEAQAQQIAQEMQSRLDAVQAKVADAPAVNAMIYYGGEGPLGVFTNGIYGDLLKLAGGATIFPDEPQNSAQVSPEVVASLNPEVIFVLEYGTSFDQMRDYLRTTFPNVPAVQNDRIVLVDGGIFPPGYRNVEAVEVFAQALHPEAFTEAAATSSYPLTIENCGRTLTFAKAPERVLTTWQAPPELLVKLGLGDKIVGTENAQQFPPPAEIAEAYAKVPVLAAQTAAKEAVIAAKPDFIIASFLAWDFDPKAGRPSLDELAALGVQVFGLSDNCTADSHVTSAEMYADMLQIGRIFGVADRAQALVDAMQAQIADVEQKVAGRPPVKVFFDAGGEGPIGTAGAGLQDEQIRVAGGENVFADHANYYEQVSLEEVAARQPEIFVVDTWDDPTYIDSRSVWLIKTFSETPAGKEQRFVEIPGIYIYYASIRYADGIEKLARAFHPDAFEE